VSFSVLDYLFKQAAPHIPLQQHEQLSLQPFSLYHNRNKNKAGGFVFADYGTKQVGFVDL